MKVKKWLIAAGISVLALPLLALGSTQSFIEKSNFSVAERCSSVLVSQTEQLLLTAAHCIHIDPETKKDEQMVMVNQQVTNIFGAVDKFEASASLVAINREKDLAVLKINTDNLPFDFHVVLRTDEPQQGEDVSVIGNPGVGRTTLRNVITKGTLMDNNFVIEKNKFYLTDTHVYFGNSGGGMYDENNNLIGIAHAIFASGGGWAPPTPIGYGLFVPLDAIEEFLIANGFVVEEGVVKSKPVVTP